MGRATSSPKPPVFDLLKGATGAGGGPSEGLLRERRASAGPAPAACIAAHRSVRRLFEELVEERPEALYRLPKILGRAVAESSSAPALTSARRRHDRGSSAGDAALPVALRRAGRRGLRTLRSAAIPPWSGTGRKRSAPRRRPSEGRPPAPVGALGEFQGREVSGVRAASLAHLGSEISGPPDERRRHDTPSSDPGGRGPARGPLARRCPAGAGSSAATAARTSVRLRGSVRAGADGRSTRRRAALGALAARGARPASAR